MDGDAKADDNGTVVHMKNSSSKISVVNCGVQVEPAHIHLGTGDTIRTVL